MFTKNIVIIFNNSSLTGLKNIIMLIDESYV